MFPSVLAFESSPSPPHAASIVPSMTVLPIKSTTLPPLITTLSPSMLPSGPEIRVTMKPEKIREIKKKQVKQKEHSRKKR